MQHETVIGIAHVLCGLFGDDIDIRADFTEQDLSEPAFYIVCIDTGHKKGFWNNYRRSQSFDIHYFPKHTGEGMEEEIAGVEEQLFSALEVIMVAGKPVAARNMKAVVQDDVLHFMVDYDIPLVKHPEQQESMGELTIKGGIKIGKETG